MIAATAAAHSSPVDYLYSAMIWTAVIAVACRIGAALARAMRGPRPPL